MTPNDSVTDAKPCVGRLWHTGTFVHKHADTT